VKILVATDGSACSRHALEEALRLLPMREAEVALVAVTPPVGLEPMAGMAPYPTVAAGTLVDGEETRHFLDDARRACEAAGVRPQVIARDGDPAGQIVEAAAAFGADIVVLGSHGRGPLGRLVLGSVSDAVAHRWTGATLIVHPAAA
jgi:nucleotide-binding universal stress UspA family protein